MENTKAVPVRKWVVRLESLADESAAIAGWHSLVVAQGWSPVGEPEVINRPEYAEFGVVGRVVGYPGVKVNADVRDAIRVPSR